MYFIDPNLGNKTAQLVKRKEHVYYCVLFLTQIEHNVSAVVFRGGARRPGHWWQWDHLVGHMDFSETH